MMDAQRFEDMVEAFGANPDRWPVSERAQALAFERANPEQALEIRNRAAALDSVLETARVAAPSDALAARILAAGVAETRFAPRWAQIAAVLALSVGLGLGWGGASLEGTGNGYSAAYAAAFSGLTDDGYDDLADWIQDEVR